jgi:integrase
MAHVREVTRTSGRAYKVRWREAERERQRTFKVKRDAERFAMTVENTKATGASTEPLAGRSQTVAEVVAASLAASQPRLKPGTYAGYVHLYESKILPTFGKQRIASVTSQQVEKWIGELVNAGRAPSTIHNHYAALNKVFRYAMRHRLIVHNPCEAADPPTAGNMDDFAAVFLTSAQVEAIAKVLDEAHPYGLLVRFASATGLRAAEIAGLRVQDVNLAAGHVEVRQTIRRVNGEWTVGTPKSARSTRNVPLLSRTHIAELRAYVMTHPHSGEPSALFWPSRRNGSRRFEYTSPVDCGGVRAYHLAPAAARLGIVEPMRFHDLRHTYASLMFAAGFKPYEVSRWMGHASVTTTDSVYAHLCPSDYNEQIARFEAFVASV